jgi:TolB-like protein/Tfp pilus assembly protein PilF
MFTDIVGYTALMGEDEQRAFELLKRNRRLQRPIIEKFNGKWLKEIGDGVLASFSTVSDAVHCALEIQNACQNENDLKLRIGIHQGEVVFEDNDVFGDGVNIASRLEPLAPVGGILVSESVHRNIRNKPDINTAFQREEHLKGVRDPIKTYQILIGGGEPMASEAQDSAQTSGKPFGRRAKMSLAVAALLIVVVASFFVFNSAGPSAESKSEVILDKSIAVLPFANMSNDQDQQYFSDGMSEEIINALAQIPNLKVASRTSAFQFRGDDQDIKSIAKTLGVATVLEGSVRKSQNRVRVTAQLINASDGFHIWSQTYERELNDIFAIQDELSRAIVDALEIRISDTNGGMVSQGTSNMEAHNLYLRGRYFWNLRDSESVKKALDFFQQAIDQDPNYALAYSGVADSYNMMSIDLSPVVRANKVKQAAYKAIQLDNSLAQAHAALGFAEMMIDRDYQAATNRFEQAISLNPNYASAHQWYSELLHLAGETEAALKEIEKSVALDPLNLVINMNEARYFMRSGEYKKAISYAKKILELNPDFQMAHGVLYGAYYEADNLKASFEHFVQSEYAAMLGDNIVDAYKLSGWKGVLEYIIEMERSNSEEFIEPAIVAEIYSINNDKESALKYLEEAVNRRDVGVIFIGLNPIWRSYHEEPGFQALLQKMGLPVTLE